MQLDTIDMSATTSAGTGKPASKSGKSAKKSKKKAVKKTVLEINVHVAATFNNTLITITDTYGNALGWSSSGNCGFRGSRKSTPHAASIAVERVLANVINLYKSTEANVFVKGPGPGRDSAVRAVSNLIKVKEVADATPLPHNGCRPKKRRRV